MADEKETKDYELSATIVVDAEKLHERYCKWMVMDGGNPCDLECFLNVLILEGMVIWTARLEAVDAMNDTHIAAIRDRTGATDE